MKVALYARVSTDDKDQNPETQLLILRDFCRVYGHEIAATFVDEGRSGKDYSNRPAFKEMLLEAKDKKHRRFDAVVCLRLDRFMRSALYGLQATEEFKAAGCDLIFVKDQIDTSTPGGKFFYTLMLAFAEMEREHHGERVSEGINRRIREGKGWGRERRRDINTQLALELLKVRRSLSAVARELGIPRNTLRQHFERKGVDYRTYLSCRNTHPSETDPSLNTSDPGSA